MAAAGFLSGGWGEHSPPLGLACPPWEFCSDSGCLHAALFSFSSAHVLHAIMMFIVIEMTLDFTVILTLHYITF